MGLCSFALMSVCVYVCVCVGVLHVPVSVGVPGLFFNFCVCVFNAPVWMSE